METLKIVITGATGVVGRRAVPLLRELGHEVTGFGRQLDLFSPDAVRRAVAGHDVLINLATHIPSSSRAFLPWAWRENSRIRSVGANHLVDAALEAGVRRVIQESFAPIYADGGDDWIEESAAVDPAPHARAALDAEAAAARFPGSVVLRFALFYGADSDFTQATIAAARKGWAAPFGSLDAYISSVTHDDAATAVVAALDAPPGIYNVVDDEPLRRRDYFGALAEALGIAPPKFAPAWTAKLAGSIGKMLSRSLRISNRKLREATGWRPRYPSAREGWRAVAEAL